jgi:hypothetical protein
MVTTLTPSIIVCIFPEVSTPNNFTHFLHSSHFVLTDDLLPHKAATAIPPRWLTSSTVVRLVRDPLKDVLGTTTSPDCLVKVDSPMRTNAGCWRKYHIGLTRLITDMRGGAA